MYKLWCIFLMQLFNFTPLKRYDLCAGALALTLGGARSWSATGLLSSNTPERKSITQNMVNEMKIKVMEEQL